MKGFFSRRKLLLMGLVAGVVARMRSDYSRDRSFNLQKEAVIDETSNNTENIISTAFDLEADWETEIEQRQAILSSTELQYPQLAYDREMSKWMIQSCKLAVQQYKTARSNSKYDGALTLLPDYNTNFHDYKQLASFQIEQEIIEDYWQLQESILTADDSDSMEKMLHDAESNIRAIVRRIVQRKHRTPVFVGFAIASKKANIIAFRGTQTQIEWWRYLQATQQDYVDSTTGKKYGRVHQGYLKIVREQMGEMLMETIRQLDPTIPCYITGHSLGGAIAILSAMEIAFKVPEIREQIQLYTYAAPRIGDRDFAEAHSRLIPNSYRIVNLSDSVPLVPPIKIENKFTTANYAHVGQKWSFTTQFGDVLLNHVVDTYRTAIEARQETLQEDAFRRMM